MSQFIIYLQVFLILTYKTSIDMKLKIIQSNSKWGDDYQSYIMDDRVNIFSIIELIVKMKKQTKKYNLALRRQSEQRKTALPQGCNLLNMISQAPQNSSCQEIGSNGRLTNIFETDKYIANKKITNDCESPFGVICKKEVQAYKMRIKKLRTIGVAGILKLKISQSFLSSSRQTGTFAQLANNTDCLTKQDLSDFYNKTKRLCEQEAQKMNSTKNYKHLQSERPFASKSKTNRLPQISSKSSSKWKQNTTRFKLSPSKLSLLSENSGVDIHSHRKKMEQLSLYTLKCEKQNIQPKSWAQNLRDPVPLRGILNSKYIQSIDREGIKISGCNKLDKEYKWVNQKKILCFEPLDSKAKYTKRSNKPNSDESRIVHSVVLNNNNNQNTNAVLSLFAPLA